MRPRGRGYLNTCSPLFARIRRKFFDTRGQAPHTAAPTGGPHGHISLSLLRAADLRSPCLPNRWIRLDRVGKLFVHRYNFFEGGEEGKGGGGVGSSGTLFERNLTYRVHDCENRGGNSRRKMSLAVTRSSSPSPPPPPPPPSPLWTIAPLDERFEG